MLGTYKLVVVVVTFEPGWGRTDLRTYTIDYGSVLELVDSDQAVSGDITIDVDTDTMQYSNVVDIKAVNKTLYMKTEDTLCLGEMDSKSHYYEIKVQLENGSVVTYNPYNWPYEKLVFSSNKTDINIYAEKDEAIKNIEISQATGDDFDEGVTLLMHYAEPGVAGRMAVIDNATATKDGCMSHEDKNKLDNIKNTYLPPIKFIPLDPSCNSNFPFSITISASYEDIFPLTVTSASIVLLWSVFTQLEVSTYVSTHGT